MRESGKKNPYSMQLVYDMLVQNNNVGMNRQIHELNFRATKEFDHYRLLSDLRLGILGCGDIGGESKCYKLDLGDNHSITIIIPCHKARGREWVEFPVPLPIKKPP